MEGHSIGTVVVGRWGARHMQGRRQGEPRDAFQNTVARLAHFRQRWRLGRIRSASHRMLPLGGRH